ncbi:MAG: hypothetical protein QW677_01875 [Pyrobaculum sp.]
MPNSLNLPPSQYNAPPNMPITIREVPIVAQTISDYRDMLFVGI